MRYRAADRVYARSMAEDCHALMPLTCFRLRPPNGLHRSIQFDSERTLKDSGKEDMTSCRDRQPLLGTGHQVPLISRDPRFSEQRFHAKVVVALLSSPSDRPSYHNASRMRAVGFRLGSNMTDNMKRESMHFQPSTTMIIHFIPR
jgi:hypothetical protein